MKTSFFSKKKLTTSFNYFFVYGFLAITLYPLLWMFLLSLKTSLQAFEYPPLFIFKPTLENYVELFFNTDFNRYFLNSVIVSFWVIVFSFSIGVPAAYGLSRTRSKMDRATSIWILMTRMIPRISFVVPFFVVYVSFKMVDTKIGLVIAYLTFTLAFVVWMMRSFFDEIPVELEEAARIDGCSNFQTFLRIVLPLSGPGLTATAILTFIMSWNEFLWALVLTRTKAGTTPIAIVNFIAYEGAEWGKIAAGGTIVILPVLAFSFVVSKYMGKGLVRGALK